MEDSKVGLVLRRLREHRGWRQKDVAARADVSQQTVSLVEQGRFGEVDLETARRVAAAVDARLEVTPRWHGPELERLLDADHARLVDALVSELKDADWEVIVEWSFNHFGERGSADVIGWHAAQRALLVGEVKSRLIDTQATNAGLDRKARIAPKLLAAERGWSATAVAAILVLPAEPTAYGAVRAHAATYDAAFPARTRAIRRWLARPDRPLRGILFLAVTTQGGGMSVRRPARQRRVRAPHSDAEAPDA